MLLWVLAESLIRWEGIAIRPSLNLDQCGMYAFRPGHWSTLEYSVGRVRNTRPSTIAPARFPMQDSVSLTVQLYMSERRLTSIRSFGGAGFGKICHKVDRMQVKSSLVGRVQSERVHQ